MTQHISARQMKVGLMLNISEGTSEQPTPTFRGLLELAQQAEQVGLDSLWMPDHLIFRFPNQPEVGPWEAFTLLSALAAVTTRISLGPLVACTSFRSPALLAKMAETLDEISGGRFILGLGAGWHQPEYDAFGYPFDHLAGRFEEALHIIRTLLKEGQCDFQGKYYQVRDCVLRPRGPSKSGPPLLIGARRPRMLKLVAQHADAWNTAWHVDPAAVQERYDPLKEACAEVGRDLSTLDITVGTAVHLSSGSEPASRRAIEGSPEEIAQKLQAFAGVGATHLVVSLNPLTPAGIEEFARIVELIH